MQKCCGLKVWIMTVPASSPRPARPATCVSKVKARSDAAKSGKLSAISAETTPTSVTPGRSSPLAIICVPTMTSASRLAKRSSSCRWTRWSVAVSRSQRNKRALGKLRWIVSITFSVPNPKYRIRTLTLGARMQHLALPVAVVTEQDALCRVVGHRHIAAITHHHKTTVATEHAACRATSIEEEDSLLFHVQNAFQLALHASADNTGIGGMEFAAQVDHLDWRESCSNTPG